MSSHSTNTYMARIRTIAPGVKVSTSAVKARDSKRDSLEVARLKVASKLRKNRAYFLAPASNDRPDLVYTERGGLYSIGVKYGNRYLSGIFDGGNYLTDVDPSAVPELLEMLASDAAAGMFDGQIQAIMLANVAAKRRI